MLSRFSLLLLLLLASCGDLPEPFLGNPGAAGRVLSQPPTPRLAVPAPDNALLSDGASHKFADALAAGLQAEEIPAFAKSPHKTDWRLITTAHMEGSSVIPMFKVVDPTGKDRGQIAGAPVSTEDWASASPVTIGTAATEAAPKISSLLTSIQTAAMHADPNSLYNRPARVQVADVTGAPGDGDLSLTKQMKTKLAALGPMVQDTATGADFIVQGNVRMVPIPGNQQRVEIQWSVQTPSGDERGKVVQLNEIPAGSLDHYWADVAMVVANEAAGGVNDVILRQSGRKEGTATQAAVHGQAQGPLLEGHKTGVEPVR